MSRKLYQDMATAFGLEFRYLGPELHDVVWPFIRAFMSEAKRDNPRFDRDRFIMWIEETRDGKRDAQGKRVVSNTTA